MFVLTHNGTVDCTCGRLYDFAQDLVEKICPMLEHSIEATFNCKRIVVTKYDTVDSIIAKWNSAPYEP